MHSIKKVSNFEEINISNIEYVSFYYDNGLNTHLLRSQICHESIRSFGDLPFLFAFVNTIGREFIIVDNSME